MTEKQLQAWILFVANFRKREYGKDRPVLVCESFLDGLGAIDTISPAHRSDMLVSAYEFIGCRGSLVVVVNDDFYDILLSGYQQTAFGGKLQE